MLQTNGKRQQQTNPCHSRLPSVTNGYSSAYVPIDLRRNQRQRLRSRSRPLEFQSGRVLYQHQSPPMKMDATSERLVSIPHLKLRCQCHLPYGRKFTRKTVFNPYLYLSTPPKTANSLQFRVCQFKKPPKIAVKIRVKRKFKSVSIYSRHELASRPI